MKGYFLRSTFRHYFSHSAEDQIGVLPCSAQNVSTTDFKTDSVLRARPTPSPANCNLHLGQSG